jgi:Fe-S-cluster containining protein
MPSPLTTLYQNVEKLSQTFFEKNQVHINCRKGCATCCYTDLSVFELEAEHIRDWFESLDEDQKEILRKSWQEPQSGKKNIFGEMTSPCTFLIDDVCTIYEARPLICRTQGLLLKYVENENIFLDICPLNFSESPLPELSEALDLDRLNTLLGMLVATEERISLKKIKEKIISI